MDRITENRVLEKLLSFLTHQWVTISDSMANSADSWSMSTRNSDSVDEEHHWSMMKLGMAAKLHAFVKDCQQKLSSWPDKTLDFYVCFAFFFYFWGRGGGTSYIFFIIDVINGF